MSAQLGKLLLIKVNEGGSWVTIGGLRTRQFSFGSRVIDITHSESEGAWREGLAGAGVKTCSVSGTGIFRDGTSDALLRTIFFGGEMRSYQLILPDFGIVEGHFLMTGLRYGGSYEGEMTFDISLESAGALIYSSL